MIKKEATKADIRDFRNWLMGQHGEYNPLDSTNCLVCQYLRARGIVYPVFGRPEVVHYTHGPYDRVGVRLPKAVAEIAYGPRNERLEHDPSYEDENFYTFEAALNRANKVLAKMR